MCVRKNKIKGGLHNSIQIRVMVSKQLGMHFNMSRFRSGIDYETYPTGPALRTSRSRSRPSMRTLTPWLRVPSKFSRETNTSSKTSSPVLEPRIPSLSSLRAQEKPGEVLSTIKALMPLEPLSIAVFAYTTT